MDTSKQEFNERSEERMQRINMKAKQEFNSYFDDESRSPSPTQLNDSLNPRSLDTIPEK